MYRIVVGSIAAFLLGTASQAALAADMPPPAPVPSWTGLYLGAGGGVQWGDIFVKSRHCLLYDYEYSEECDYVEDYRHEFDDNNSQVVGIVQGGYDFQLGDYFVSGAYVSWTFGDGLGSDRHEFYDEGIHERWDTNLENILTVASRTGFLPMPNLLVYGLAGWSWADIDHHYRLDDEIGPLFRLGDDFNANGYTIGLGAEYKFTDSISIRGEYRFTDFDSFNDHDFFSWDQEVDDNVARTRANVDVQQVLFTLNWRFGGLGGPF